MSSRKQTCPDSNEAKNLPIKSSSQADIIYTFLCPVYYLESNLVMNKVFLELPLKFLAAFLNSEPLAEQLVRQDLRVATREGDEPDHKPADHALPHLQELTLVLELVSMSHHTTSKSPAVNHNE